MFDIIFFIIMALVFLTLSLVIAIKEHADSKIHIVLMFICMAMSIVLFFAAVGSMLVD